MLSAMFKTKDACRQRRERRGEREKKRPSCRHRQASRERERSREQAERVERGTQSRVRGLGLQLAEWELSSGNNNTFPTGVIISAFALRGRPVTLDSVAVKWVEWSSSSVRLQSSQLQGAARHI